MSFSYFTKKVLPGLILLCFVVGSASATLVTLNNAPDYDWWKGCSPTSTGMMMGYYDINGYLGLNYDDLVPGGVAELNTFGTGTYLANDAIASPGHIDDFYSGGNNAIGDDVDPPWHDFDCLADFMGTSQDLIGNPNGWTRFYFWNNGAPFTAADAWAAGVWSLDGMYGIGEYVVYSGYSIDTLYTQLIVEQAPVGMTFAQYKAEIDSGRPALIHVEGHTMFAYGYDTGVDDTLQTVYIHDTWTAGAHTMPWGQSYAGRTHWGMTCFTPSGGEPIPEPSTMLLIGTGMFGFVVHVFRRKKKT